MRAERLVSVEAPPALVCADRCQVSTDSVPGQYRFSTRSVPVQYQVSTGSVPGQYRFSAVQISVSALKPVQRPSLGKIAFIRVVAHLFQRAVLHVFGDQVFLVERVVLFFEREHLKAWCLFAHRQEVFRGVCSNRAYRAEH